MQLAGQPRTFLEKVGGKKIHFIGIKGIGLSAVAQYFFWNGAKVTGSDNAESFQTDAVLKKLHIPCRRFSSKNINSGLDLAVYSSAYNQNHPEIKKALELGIPVKSYGEVLAEIFNKTDNKIVVTGTHGKTTTTTLLGHLLGVAGLEPTVFVGGISNNWQSNFKKGLPAQAGANKWAITEGDEYQKKFLYLKPDYLLITNIDFDHPDSFKNKKDYRQAFEQLKKQTKNKVFLGQKITPEFRKFLAKINFPLLGEKNKENAFLVYKLAKELKISDEKIKQAFETFKGTKRRMEYKGVLNLKANSYKLKAMVYDDYGHHPEEIKATLSALKEKYPDYKLLTIFQPHTFSRTKSLLKEFGRCFAKADFVYLLPTFASAREQKPKGNMDKILFEEVSKYHQNVKSLPFNFKLLISEINDLLKAKSSKLKAIVLTIGAGDVYKIAERLTKQTLLG
jgi:UDP-N-acetylmuramate--alanine ligase